MRTTTTVQVDKELMQRAKILAIQLEMHYSEFVNMAIRHTLERSKQGELFKKKPT
jgi:predicted transcriptional regulator